MPSFPPRSEPIKKQEQLEQRTYALHQAIEKGFALQKTFKLAEQYRTAQISLRKAVIHLNRELALQDKPIPVETSLLETEIQGWQRKTLEDIIAEVRAVLYGA